MKLSQLILGLCLALCATVVHAETWPSRPIHWIVPYPPGGGTDLMARVIGVHLEKLLGQSVVIDNKPGGSTVVGTAALTHAEPDGYTVGMVFDSLAINPVLGLQTPYNPKTDVAPIIKLANVPLVFVVNTAQVPMKTLPEVVAYSKSHPQWFTFGSLGPGSPHEIGFLWFKHMSGMDALVVPYRGVAPALQAVVAGQIKGMFIGVSVADGYIKKGTLHTLAVTSAQRLASAPDVPTIAELGYPDYDYSTFYGLAAPKGTPPQIVERLNKAINQVLKMPDVKERLGTTGAVLAGGTSQEFGAFLAANFGKFQKIMALSAAKAN